MSGLSHTYFLGLSAVGFNYLWGELIRNGAAQAIGAVRRGGVFPDGTIVRRTFTGLPGLDSYVLSPVIFYDGVTNGQNLAHHLLLVSLFSTMQSTSVCMLASGWRKGRRKWYSTLYVFPLLASISLLMVILSQRIYCMGSVESSLGCCFCLSSVVLLQRSIPLGRERR